MKKVSIIIPSYNSNRTLDRTINSILAQSALDSVQEIIIVDSSSDPASLEQLKSFRHEKLRIISLKEKTSPSKGRNTGEANARGELLCFIDSDVYLNEDWLAKVLEAYGNGCLVGCGSVSIPPFQENNTLALAQLYLQFNESLNVGQTRPVTMVPACNMFVKRSLFEQAGGFPDIRASEDVLLCLKLGEVAKVWFVPGARCFHVFREDKEAYFRNQVILGKYIIVYRRMMYNKWFYKGLWPVFLLPAFLVIKSTRIKLRIMKAGWPHFRKFLISSPLFTAGFYYWAVGFIQGCLENKNDLSKS